MLLPARAFIFHELLIDFFVISVSSGMLILRRDRRGRTRVGLHESQRCAIDPCSSLKNSLMNIRLGITQYISVLLQISVLVDWQEEK